MTASNSRLSHHAAVRRLSDPVAASQFQHLLFADRWDRREVVIVLAVGSKNSAELKVPHFTRFTAHWILPSQWVDFIRQPWRRRRDRLPTTSAQSNQSGFHSQIDRSGQPRDQQSQTSNCSRSRRPDARRRIAVVASLTAPKMHFGYLVNQIVSRVEGPQGPLFSTVQIATRRSDCPTLPPHSVVYPANPTSIRF